MHEYPVKKVAEIVSGKLIQNSDHVMVSDLVIDSRKLNYPVSSLFFALTTPRNDGHKYIGDLIKKGVCNFCVKTVPEGLTAHANFIVVDDTLKALQNLSGWHRAQFSYPVIGITGSNGKTVVKEWLWQLLNEEKTIVRSPQSYNSQVGVPLSVWQMEEIHNLGIFEAGISQPDEMGNLERIIKPDIGIITNIGSAHDQFFRSRYEKVSEKLRLFTSSKYLIYCRDSELIHDSVMRLTPSTTTLFCWGWSPDCTLQIIDIDRSKDKTTIKCLFSSKEMAISIPYTDDAAIENAMHCWSVMLLLGYGNEVTSNRMMRLLPVAMRLEMKEGINGCLLINDTYSSDLDSLSVALDFMVQQTNHVNKSVILSDMLQSETDSSKLYQYISTLLSGKGVTRIIGIGEEIKKYAHLFDMRKEFYADTDNFISNLKESSFRNESILIKGARVFAFERIIELLQQKAHETVLEVNLGALIHNLNYFRSLVKPSTRIMAMVKAFSYGSGSFEIANILQFHHIDYLGVAYPDEGVELRKAGISVPIMVMNPEMTGMELMIKYNLEPEIYSFRTLRLFATTFQAINHKQETASIHLKFDTGMHRLGFLEDELEQLSNELLKYPFLKVVSAFSHLAASESATLDSFTEMQISIFNRMTSKLQDGIGYTFLRHILNSAGISRHNEAQYDMVRLGISLYGVSSLKAIQDKLVPVSSLKSVISQIKWIKKGETVGYNCMWRAERDSKIAVIPVGYADGLGRKLSNTKGSMFVNGHMVPIIGNINMDMTVLDITGIDAEEGDEAEVFGEHIPIGQIAEQMETIPYEILTGISRRVKRVYYQE